MIYLSYSDMPLAVRRRDTPYREFVDQVPDADPDIHSFYVCRHLLQ